MDAVTSNPPAIRVNDLTFAYPGGQPALDKIQLEIQPGEIVALAGANGSGKSTLMLHLAGLTQSDSVEIFGHKAKGKANLRKIRGRVGILFQDSDDQLFMPTVYEDVAFGPLNQDLPRDEVRSKTMEALEAVGLAHLKDRPPHHLSGGEKRLAALATIIALNPDLVLMDEPTANLDHAARRNFMDVLPDVAKQGSSTVLIATHDLDMALGLCDRILLIHKGRICGDGPILELLDDESRLGKCGLTRPSSLKIRELETRIRQLQKPG